MSQYDPSKLSIRRTLFEQILEKSAGLEEILQQLDKTGSHLWKVRSPTKWFRRKYFLDLNSMRVKYEPTYNNNCAPNKKKKRINISEINDVRSGWKTDTFNKVGAIEDKNSSKPGYKPTCEERNCFSIIYGPKMETLDLMAPNGEIADKWVRALRYLISWLTSREQERSYENWLRKKFASADLDKNKCLNFSETLKLLLALNINMNEDQARRLFNEANTTKSIGEQVLDEDEFIKFYFKLLQRPEIEKLFGSYAAEGLFTANRLCQFLQKEQGGYENVTIDECEELIKIHEQSDLKLKGQMSSSGFVNMLLSPNFELFNKEHRTIHHDMTQPLSHYYIATSHNTYLLGNQLSSQSSVEGYVNALRRACRCVELDIWDGPDGEPIVYHGYTLTSKIPFKEVLSDAIKPYAFMKSDYPLILSFENHCSQPFQEKVAEYVRKILGDMIYTEDVTEDMEELPSPEELKGKIILKAKKIKPKTDKNVSYSNFESKTEIVVHETTTTSIIKNALNDDEIDSRETKNVQVHTYRSTDSNPPIATAERESEDSESESEVAAEDDRVDFVDSNREKKTRVHDEKITSNDLSSLINIMQGTHFSSFEESKLNGKCYQICSIAESKALKFIENCGADFVDYNKHKLSRIYPAGARTRSTNFDPMPFWTVGCQCVALNYQTEDLPNFYHRCWFAENGYCGYLLKPEFLRNPSTRFSPTDILRRPQVLLRLKIISAQHLPKIKNNSSEIVDPYVEIKVIGLQQDFSKHVTHAINNNGFNPIWDATFDIRVRCPELAMLYFCIKDRCQTGTDEPLAYYAIPFSAISTGYRHIPLVNLRGASLSPSTLFVHVRMS